MTTDSLAMYVIVMVTSGIFLWIMLTKLERIYEKSTKNIGAEPENVAYIREQMDQMRSDMEELASYVLEMYKMQEETNAGVEDINGRFVKQFPNTRTFTQVMQSSSPKVMTGKN